MSKIGYIVSSVTHKQPMVFGLVFAAIFFVLFKLSTLVPGMSLQELDSIKTGLGWHGLYNNPLFFPIQFLRSTFITLFGSQHIFIDRLPNALFGLIAIICFAAIVKVWHDSRTAVLATLLFLTSAWVLHVSRTANFEVVYLCLLPVILVSNIVLHKYAQKLFVLIATIAVWGSILAIPGGLWFVLANVLLQKKDLAYGWASLTAWWQYLLVIAVTILWIPLLLLIIIGDSGILTWIGLPVEWGSPLAVIKDFVAVPVHLFLRGPENPFLWLGRAPILDFFTLVASILGIYYYVDHWQAARSKSLIVMFIIGFLLVGLGGSVGLSVLVPLLYLFAAMGIAYLTKQWTKVFPINPLARGVGLGLIILVVSLSCIYNLRAYFIAWPNNNVTQATFRYHP